MALGRVFFAWLRRRLTHRLSITSVCCVAHGVQKNAICNLCDSVFPCARKKTNLFFTLPSSKAKHRFSPIDIILRSNHCLPMARVLAFRPAQRSCVHVSFQMQANAVAMPASAPRARRAPSISVGRRRSQLTPAACSGATCLVFASSS